MYEITKDGGNNMSGKAFRIIAKCMTCLFIVVVLIAPLTDFPDPITKLIMQNPYF
jgi:hypothetical protein